MGCGKALLKTWLIIFNVLFFLIGLALIVCAAIVLIDKTTILNAFSYVPSTELVSADDVDKVLSSASYLKQAAYGIIGLGGFIFVVGFCGCCGAMKESKCLLGLYAVVVLAVFIGQLAGGILTYIYKDKAHNHMKGYLESTMKYKYKGSGYSNGKIEYATDVISQAWDLAQVTFKCCGISSASDWANLTEWNKTYTDNGESIKASIPVTCCEMTGMEDFPDNLNKISITNTTACLTKTDAYNDKGCYDTIYDLFVKYGTIILGACVGLLAFELFSVIFAFLLMRSISKDGESA